MPATATAKTAALRALQELPGVGPSIAGDLYALGLRAPADLVGRSPDDLYEKICQMTSKPHGIFLVTGPTGSGKSTTLYSALKRINSSVRKIITIEDPIEYQLDGINQIHVNPQIGLTFAAGLRHIVRQRVQTFVRPPIPRSQ